ncbi:hypothetical protein KAI12_02345 [Candidatus Bathyarchaeota archaeon]|nr:hypothetical protein [Candidatus Bathyarchaeota archaeon]
MTDISRNNAAKIAIEFLKEEKNTEEIEVAEVEEKSENWIVTGTCPINLEGHKWIEKFEVIVGQSGKIKSTNYALL